MFNVKCEKQIRGDYILPNIFIKLRRKQHLVMFCLEIGDKTVFIYIFNWGVIVLHCFTMCVSFCGTAK